MSDCSICGADSAWKFDAPGVSGGITYCAACFPQHLRPLIGTRITAVIPEPVLPRGDEPVTEAPATKPARKRAPKAKAQ